VRAIEGSARALVYVTKVTSRKPTLSRRGASSARPVGMWHYCPPALKDDQPRNIEAPALHVVGKHERVCSAAKLAAAHFTVVAPQIKTTIILGRICGQVFLPTEAVSVSPGHRGVQ
jgi:hypothetical protein